MPFPARRALLIGSLAIVILGACTPGTGTTIHSSTSADLPPISRSAPPSSTTATSQPATATVRHRPSSSHGASTATSAPPPNDQARLTRPLHLPVLRPGQTCPTSRGSAIHTPVFNGTAPGVGPVRPLAGDLNGDADLTSNTHAPGWLAIKSLWFSDPSYRGPFLVRIRRLDGPGPAGLLEDPSVTSFFVPAGPTFNGGPGGYRTITGATWVKTPGCMAWQVDGLTFSNVIVIRLLCRPPNCALPTKPLLPPHTTATGRTGSSAAPPQAQRQSPGRPVV